MSVTTDGQLLQDYLQSAGIVVNIQNEGANQVASFVNAEGQAEAIVIDAAGSTYHVCREPLSDSGWNIFGLGAGFNSVAAIDGTTAWAIGTDGNVWRCDHGRWTQSAPLGTGNAAAQVSTGVDGTVWVLDITGRLFVKGAGAFDSAPELNDSSAPVLLTDAAGRLNFFGLDVHGAVWTIRQDVVGGAWGAWQSFGAPSAEIAITSFVVGANPDGRLQVFGVGSDQAVHTVYQQQVGGDWSAWGRIAPQDPPVASLQVAANEDGRMELFALTVPDESGSVAVQHIWQTAPNNGWGAWTAFLSLNQPLSHLSVVRDAAGRLNVVVLAPDAPNGAACLWTQQTAPNGTWTAWTAALAASALGNVITTLGPLALDGSGALQLVGADQTGVVYVATLSSGTWQGWQSLSVPIGTPEIVLAMATNADGRLELFAQTQGEVFHLWQTSPGGPWTDWYSLPDQGQPDHVTLGRFAVTCDGTGTLQLIALGGGGSWQTGYDRVGFDRVAQWMPWASGWWAWYPLWGSAQAHSMPSGRGDDFWAIFGSNLAHCVRGTWSTVPLPSGLPGNCLAVDSDGVVWILCADEHGTFLRYENGVFTMLSSNLPGATSIGAANPSSIYAVAGSTSNDVTAYALYALRDGGWVAVDTPHLFNLNFGSAPVQVSVGSDGLAWLLDGSRNIWAQASGPATWSWEAFPAPTAGTTMRFVSAARGGNAWGIDSTGAVWQFKGSWTPFTAALPGGAAIAQIAAGTPGTLWAIDGSQQPYGYTPRTGWSIAWALMPSVVQVPTEWALRTDELLEYVPAAGYAPAFWNRIAVNFPYVPAAFSAGRDGTIVVLDTAGALHVVVGSTAAVASAPANVTQVAVVDADLLWVITKEPSSGAEALHLYREGSWEQVTLPAAILGSGSVPPLLSSAPDGTVWLLGRDGVPRRLDWTEHAPPPRPQGSTALSAIAAANINPATVGTGQPHEAWGVATNGTLRRSFGQGGAWIDTHTALPMGASAARVSSGADGTLWAIDTAGNLYTRAPWMRAPASATDGPTSVAAALDSTGTAHLLAVDAAGGVWGTRRAAAGTVPPWRPWQQFPSSSPQVLSVQAVTRSDGTLLALGLSVEGVIIQWTWDPSTSTWSDSTPLFIWGQSPADAWVVSFATGQDSSRRLSIIALTQNGMTWVITEGAGGGWGPWMPLSMAAPLSALAGTGGPNAETLAFFAIDWSGAAYCNVQQSGGAFGGWQSMGSDGLPSGVGLRQLTTATTSGTLMVIAVGTDGLMYVTSAPATAPGGWSAWTSIGGVQGAPPRALAAVTGTSPAVRLFMLGADGAVYTGTYSGTWSAWSATGAVGHRGAPLASLAVCTIDAAPVLVAGGGGSVWTTTVDADAPTGWGDWRALSGAQTWQPVAAPAALAQAPVGTAQEMWAAFRDGSVRVCIGGTWHTVPFPSASAPANAVGVSLGTDGLVRAATATDCYVYSGTAPGGTWTHLGSNRFAQAPVGRATNLWSIDPDHAVWRSRDGGATWWKDSASSDSICLSACADGSIWSVSPGGTAMLAATWQRVMRPTGMAGIVNTTGLSEIVAGVDELGTRYAFLVANGALWYTYEIAHHTWIDPQFIDALTGVSGLRLTNQQDTGALIVWSAISHDGNVGIAMKLPGERYAFGGTQMSIATTAGGLGASLELVARSGSDWTWICMDPYQVLVGTSAGPTSILVPVAVSAPQLTPGTILHLPWPRRGSTIFGAVLDTENNLWMLGDINIDGNGATCTPIKLTGEGTALGAGVTSIAALLQADEWAPPQQRFYAMASNTAAGSTPALWMLNRIDACGSTGQAGTWSAWTPLGENYASVYNGPFGAPVDTLFGTLADGAQLGSLRQNPATGRWTDGIVKRPSWSGDSIEEVAMYQTEATFRDVNGILTPGVAITVSADTPTEAWINNTVYTLGPGKSVTVLTDQRGTVRVKTPAAGLGAPQLTFSAPSLGGGGGSSSINPSQHLYDFFHGTGKLPIGGKPPTALTACGLQSLNSQLSTSDAQQAVTAMNTIAGMPQSSSPPPPGGSLVHLGDLPGSIFSRAWHAIKHVGESVVHAIDKKVVQAAVEVEGAIVKVTMKIAGEVVAVVNMAVKTVADAVRAIEAVVASVVADLKAFIEWLKLIFDWGNIIKTQEAITSLLEQGVDVLLQQLAAVRKQVAVKFAELSGDLTGAINSIQSQGNIGGYSTFADLPTQVSPGGIRHGFLGSAGTQPVPGASPVHHNWFLNKVLDHLTPKFSAPAIVGLDAGSFLSKLNLHDAITDIWTAARDLYDFLETVITHPSQFASKGIADLIGAAKSFLEGLLVLIEGLIEACLDLAQQALEGLLAMLRTRINIPGIDTLFKLVDGKPMTLMNLGALVLAVPAYILYQVIYPGDPGPLWGDDAAPGARGTRAQNEAHAYLAFGLVQALIIGLRDVCIIAATPGGTLPPWLGTFITVAANLNAAVLRFLGWPNKDGFPAPPSSFSEAEVAILFNWGVYWIPILYGFASLGIPAFRGDPAQVVRTALGATALISAVVAAIKGLGAQPPLLGPKSAATTAIQPLGLLMSVFLIKEVRQFVFEGTEGLFDPAWLVFIVDALDDTAIPILHEEAVG